MFVFLALVVINALLAAGDLLAKRAVVGAERDAVATAAALALWLVACCMWLPVMRARGFTRLVALADAIGLVLVASTGYLFLGERLSPREGVGVALALGAVVLLG
jgi:drug/metabolite transporter (DMT)-like permease